VVEVGARVGDGELVGEGLAAADRGLGHARYAVHGVVQGDTVPVHAGRGRQLVVDLDPQQVAGSGPQQGPWHRVAVGPGVDHWATEIDRGRSRGQFCGHDTLDRAATQRLGVRQHRGRAPACTDRCDAAEPEGTEQDVTTGQLRHTGLAFRLIGNVLGCLQRGVLISARPGSSPIDSTWTVIG
jgi:hypothetical protein